MATPHASIGADLDPNSYNDIRRRLAAAGVSMLAEVLLHHVSERALVLSDVWPQWPAAQGEPAHEVEFDSLVYDLGDDPHDELAADLAACGLAAVRIGDCLTPRNVIGAVRDAADLVPVLERRLDSAGWPLARRRRELVHLRELSIRQPPRGGRYVRAHLRGLRSAGDDTGHARLARQPAKREVGDRAAARCGERGELRQQLPVLRRHHLLRRLRRLAEPRPGKRRVVLAVLAGEEAARQREVRDQAEAARRAGRHDFFLEGAVEQVVVALTRDERRPAAGVRPLVRFADLAAREVRVAEVAHLALRDDQVEGGQDLVDRRGRVRPVQLEQVDVIGAEPVQGFVDGGENVGPGGSDPRPPAIGAGVHPELGGDDDLAAQASEGLAGGTPPTGHDRRRWRCRRTSPRRPARPARYRARCPDHTGGRSCCTRARPQILAARTSRAARYSITGDASFSVRGRMPRLDAAESDRALLDPGQHRCERTGSAVTAFAVRHRP